MPKAKIPAWWLVVGGDAARRAEEIFERSMADLPVSHAAFAERLGVSASTVTRWSNGKVTPEPSVMLRAVAEAKRELQTRLDHAIRAEQILECVAAAEAAESDGGLGAASSQVEALTQLLTVTEGT